VGKKLRKVVIKLLLLLLLFCLSVVCCFCLYYLWLCCCEVKINYIISIGQQCHILEERQNSPRHHKIRVAIERGEWNWGCEICSSRPQVGVTTTEIVSGDVATDAFPFRLQYVINKLDPHERAACSR